MSTYAGRYAAPIIDLAGNALVGASVLVRLRSGGATATVYSNRTKTPMANPVPSGVALGTSGLDTAGNLVFYADPGDAYELLVTPPAGATVGPIPVGSIASDPSELGARVTKRATLPISGVGQTLSAAGSVQDWANRSMVCLPHDTTRWRLRVRNYSALHEAAGVGTVNCAGMWVGDPEYPATDRWLGVFATAPAQAVAPFAVSAADTASPWVTDPALQFLAGEIQGTSIAFTGDGTTRIYYDPYSCTQYKAGAGTAAVAGGTAWASTDPHLGTLDCRIEYECLVPAEVPHILVVGTSIEQGSIGSDNGPWPFEAWPGAYAMRSGALVTNLGIGSSTIGLNSEGWISGVWKFARADLATTVPDAVIIGGWSNDISRNITTWQGEYRTLLTMLRALGIRRIYGGTIIPWADNPSEVAIAPKNAWVRTVPRGLEGVIDFNIALRKPATQTQADPDYITVYPHPDRNGYQRMAQEVPILRSTA